MDPPKLTGFRRPAFPYDVEANSACGPGTLTLSVAQEKLHELTQHIQNQQQQQQQHQQQQQQLHAHPQQYLSPPLQRTTQSSVVSFGLDTVSGRRSQAAFNSGVFHTVSGFGQTPMSTIASMTGVTATQQEEMGSLPSLAAAATAATGRSQHDTSPLATTRDLPPTAVGSPSHILSATSNATTSTHGTAATATSARGTPLHDPNHRDGAPTNDTFTATTTTTQTSHWPASTSMGLNSPSTSPMSSLALTHGEGAVEMAMARAVLIKERLLKIQAALAYRERHPYVAPNEPPQVLLFQADEATTGGMFAAVTPTVSNSGAAAAFSITSPHAHSYSSPSSMSMSGNTNAPRRPPPSLDGTNTYPSESSTLLSPFERVRIGKMLGQLVLDIASLSHCIQDGVFSTRAISSSPAMTSSSNARSGSGSGPCDSVRRPRRGTRRGQKNQPEAKTGGSPVIDGTSEDTRREGAGKPPESPTASETQRRPSSVESANSPRPPTLQARRKTRKPSQCPGFMEEDPASREAAVAGTEADPESFIPATSPIVEAPEEAGGLPTDAKPGGDDDTLASPRSPATDTALNRPDGTGPATDGKEALPAGTPPLRPSSLTHSGSASGGSAGTNFMVSSVLALKGSCSTASSSRRSGRSGQSGQSGRSADRDTRSLVRTPAAAAILLYSPSHDSCGALQTSARESVHDACPLRRTDDLALSLSHHRSSTGNTSPVAHPLPPLAASSSGGPGGATSAAQSGGGVTSPTSLTGSDKELTGGKAFPPPPSPSQHAHRKDADMRVDSPGPAVTVSSAPARMQALEALSPPSQQPPTSQSMKERESSEIHLQPFLQNYLLYDEDQPRGSTLTAEASATSASPPADEGQKAKSGSSHKGSSPLTNSALASSVHQKHVESDASTGEAARPDDSATPAAAVGTKPAALPASALGPNTQTPLQTHYSSPTTRSAHTATGVASFAKAPHRDSTRRDTSTSSSLLTTPPRVPLPAGPPTGAGPRPTTPLSPGEAEEGSSTRGAATATAPPPGSRASTPSDGSGVTNAGTTTTASSHKEAGSPETASPEPGVQGQAHYLAGGASARTTSNPTPPVSSYYQPRSYSLHNTVNFGSASSLNSNGTGDVRPSHTGTGHSGSNNSSGTPHYSGHNVMGHATHAGGSWGSGLARQRLGSGSVRGTGNSVDSPRSARSSELQFKRVISMDSEYPEEDTALANTYGSQHDFSSAGNSIFSPHINPDGWEGDGAQLHGIPAAFSGNEPLRFHAGVGGYRNLDSDGSSSQMRRVSFSDGGAASLQALSAGSRDGHQDVTNVSSPSRSPPVQSPFHQTQSRPEYTVDVNTLASFEEILDEIQASVGGFTTADFSAMGLCFAIPGLVATEPVEGRARERSGTVAPSDPSTATAPSSVAGPHAVPVPTMLPLCRGGDRIAVTPENFYIFHSLSKAKLRELEAALGHPLRRS